MKHEIIEINCLINAPIEKVWECWVSPYDILKWNAASEDWHTTKAQNDLRVGGRFIYRMEAKDGSFGFDFGGEYTLVSNYDRIEYVLDDGRMVSVAFQKDSSHVLIIQKFEAENENPIDLQRFGWQEILNNFKKFVENN